jgi:hypothetical protein
VANPAVGTASVRMSKAMRHYGQASAGKHACARNTHPRDRA